MADGPDALGAVTCREFGGTLVPPAFPPRIRLASSPGRLAGGPPPDRSDPGTKRGCLEGLARNRAEVVARIAAAARRAGRTPNSVQLLCVTKTVEPEVAAALVALGELDLGENRVPELERKHAWFEARGDAQARPRWHFIGHVQRNKARRVVRLVDVIHSIDSGRLLDAVVRLAQEEARRPGVYLQVKLTGEDAKTGLAPEDVSALVDRTRDADRLDLLGLMTMAPLSAPPGTSSSAAALQTFEALAKLAGELPADAFHGGRPRLSMGMSGDLEEAIQAGADIVRVGSALFRTDAGAPAATLDDAPPAEGAPEPRSTSERSRVRE